MTTSSQQDLYSITLDDTVSNTITINNNDFYSYDTMVGNISITGNTDDHITVSSDYNIQYEINFGNEWSTHFPDYYKVEAMCQEYPSLEKALENFKTIYEMVKDDYDSKVRERNK